MSNVRSNRLLHGEFGAFVIRIEIDNRDASGCSLVTTVRAVHRTKKNLFNSHIACDESVIRTCFDKLLPMSKSN